MGDAVKQHHLSMASTPASNKRSSDSDEAWITPLAGLNTQRAPIDDGKRTLLPYWLKRWLRLDVISYRGMCPGQSLQWEISKCLTGASQKLIGVRQVSVTSPPHIQ